jgi:hypothetical protein
MTLRADPKKRGAISADANKRRASLPRPVITSTDGPRNPNGLDVHKRWSSQSQGQLPAQTQREG